MPVSNPGGFPAMLVFFTVSEQTAAVIEAFGRFNRIAYAGLHWKKPWENVVGRMSLRVQEMQVDVETKTSDDVFVRLRIAVQFFVIPERVKEAFYRLSNAQMQIESYVFDEVRSAVPKMSLDDVFQNKDFIANSVKEGLTETMTEFGYGIVRALVNDIDPDARVKAAMNEINAATRLRKAAEERGEAERILKVKQAQGEAESNILKGKGIAGQRKAIIDGLRESVEEFQKGIPGASGADVMQVLLMTQYFDTLKEIGASAKTNAVFLPHGPGAMTELASQISQGMLNAETIASRINGGDGSTPRPPAPAQRQTAPPGQNG
jgi:regulator of protease activity HflC (stomatin/prohibitin superfamily)